MNIFIIKWDYNNNNFLRVAKKIESDGHQIAYWVGASQEDVVPSNRRIFPQTVFHNIFEAHFGKPALEFKDTDFAPPGEKIIKNLFEAESILSTLKQFEKLKISVFEKKNLYHNYLQYWLGVIEKLKPDLIIFAISPHTGFDFVLFSIAKLLGIKTIMFDYTGIADRHLLINDYTEGSRRLKKELENNKNKNFLLDNLSRDIREYYDGQINQTQDPITRDFKALKNQYSGLNLLAVKVKIIAKSASDLSIFKKIYFYLLKFFGDNIKKEHARVQQRPDFNKKFIYVALHYQPECATSPLGGIFVDQILMIKILSQALPDDWLLYVKEHPVQWLSQGLNYTDFRYPGFYKAITAIKKVILVPQETPAVELINKSQAVATVTGTAGREAVLRQKPALIFGYASYRDCVGVFKVSDVTSCQEVLQKIDSGFFINQGDVLNYLASLDKTSIHTYFEKATEVISGLSPEEHVDNLASAILAEIEQNKNVA